MNYAEALEKTKVLLDVQTEIYQFLFERAALSKRPEAIDAWKSSKASLYDLRNLVQYLEILTRE